MIYGSSYLTSQFVIIIIVSNPHFLIRENLCNPWLIPLLCKKSIYIINV